MVQCRETSVSTRGQEVGQALSNDGECSMLWLQQTSHPWVQQQSTAATQSSSFFCRSNH
jgi:hypothetical protein